MQGWPNLLNILEMLHHDCHPVFRVLDFLLHCLDALVLLFDVRIDFSDSAKHVQKNIVRNGARENGMMNNTIAESMHAYCEAFTSKAEVTGIGRGK
jgi:hypothetical protein